MRDSRCSDPPEVRLSDALDTIRPLGQFDYIAFSDGSAEGGVQGGDSAAVMCSGSVDNPVRVDTFRRVGASVTSSFDPEVEALGLALSLSLSMFWR